MRKFFARDILDLLIEFTYLAIIFFIPIYFAVWFPTYNIFELDKLVIFKIGVLFLLGLSLIKIIFYYPLAPFLKTEFRPQNLWQRYFLAPSVFIIVLSLVWVFALNTGMSFFGSYARQEGLLSYWFYFLWLVLTVFNVISVNNIFSKSKALNHEEISGLIARNLKRIIVTITISSALVSFYGIMQFLGIDFLIWPEPPVLTHRAFSSFGQPNFLASWLLLTIPLAFYLIKIQSGTFNKFWFYLILVLQLICLFCTASRGAWLALIGTGLLFLFFYLWRSIKLSRSKKILAVFLIFILAGVLLFGLDKLSNGRLARSFNVGDGSVAAHLDFWVASGSAIKLKPLVGYGLDNYSDVFARAYKPNWAAYGNINAYSDRAHNFILDILLGGGLIGLVAWLVLFYYLFRLIRDNSQFKKYYLLNKTLVFSLIAYWLSLGFSFSFVAGNIYFFLLVAILISLNAAAKSAAGNQTIDIWPRLSVALSKLHLSKKYKLTIGKIDTANKSVNEKRAEIKILLALAVVLIMAWQIVAQLKILIADHYFNALYYNLGDRKYFTAYTLANYIINVGTSPNNQVYYDRFLADKISDFWPEISELSVRQPGALKLAQILGDLPDQGYENLLVKAKIDSTLRNFSAAEDYLVRAEKIGPNLPQTYFEAAQISLNKSDLNAAKDNYQLAFSKLPDFNDPLMNNSHRQVALRYRYILEKDLGDIYWQKKDYAAAERYYQKSYLSNPADFTLYKKIADTYYARREYDKAIYYNKLGFRRNPNDYAWPLSISLVYKEAGDKVKALESLNQAIKLAPTNDVLEKMRLEYVK